MTFKSKPFYMKLKGDYALFSTPSSRGGGEKMSYQIPTREALRGITDAVYFKPVFKNCIDEVKIINPIQTQTMGFRALLKSGKADLNYYTYLKDVEYLVKYHFEWDKNREDLIHDRNEMKHQEIMKRSLKKGGRYDIFLGTRECVGYVEKITKDEYDNTKGFYDNQNVSFGIMFHSFIYPLKPGGELISCFTEIIMEKGVIKFIESEECEIKNVLSNYTFKYPEITVSVENELEQYKDDEEVKS